MESCTRVTLTKPSSKEDTKKKVGTEVENNFSCKESVSCPLSLNVRNILSPRNSRVYIWGNRAEGEKSIEEEVEPSSDIK
jgi:hypothetical protein